MKIFPQRKSLSCFSQLTRPFFAPTNSARRASMLLLLLATAVFGQAPSNWASVKQLAAGSEIRVNMTDGRKIVGTFQSATDDDLLVQTPKSQQTLARITIAKVSTKGRSHRLRNALVGFGGGAGVGLIVGAVSDSRCPQGGCFAVGKNLGKEVFTPLGALIGVTVGALLPTGGWHNLYRAK